VSVDGGISPSCVDAAARGRGSSASPSKGVSRGQGASYRDMVSASVSGPRHVRPSPPAPPTDTPPSLNPSAAPHNPGQLSSSWAPGKIFGGRNPPGAPARDRPEPPARGGGEISPALPAAAAAARKAARPAEPWVPRPDPLAQTVDVASGNPAVEQICGVVHLFRDTMTRDEAGERPARQVPDGRSPELACLSVPADMALSEFCRFLGGYLPQITSMRVVRKRPDAAATYMVLLAFGEQGAADEFFLDCNGAPFSSLEPEVVCRLGFIRSVEFSDGATSIAPPRDAAALPPVRGPPAGQAELPACPVCLERLDEHISGVVTTVCNHAFHNECLLKWGDTSCPVCRYAHNPASPTRCAACGAADDLWMCLVCGHVGCGRYKGAHAREHWEECDHCYALELSTQRVWDYVSDGWVHRLVQTRAAGAEGETFIVEVPGRDAGAAARGRRGPSGHGAKGGGAPAGKKGAGPGKDGGGRRGSGSGAPPGGEGPAAEDDEVEAALLQSQLDAITREYEHLLAGQLESQRCWFEGRLETQAAELGRRCRTLEEKLDASVAAGRAADDDNERLRSRLRDAEAALAEERGSSSRLREELDFLKSLSDTVLADQQAWRGRVESAERALAGKDAEVSELRDQVRDLMLFLEAQSAVAADPDLAGGSVEVAPAPRRRARGRGR